MPRLSLALPLLAALVLGALPARAQAPGAGGPPPAVGVARVEPRAITEAQEFVGRIQAPQRVALVARVTAFIDRQTFTEGAEVKAGDLLYVLEQAPFQADLAAKQASVAQAAAQLDNAKLAFTRANSLLKTPAGQQAAVDSARATMLSDAAQLQAAEAQARQSAINLGYTEIHAPIAGKIGRSAVTPGNVVSPGSGTLTTLVSVDPMYVVFPVPVRTVTEVRHALSVSGATDPYGAFRIRLRLPDGREYAQAGRLDFVDNTVSQGTDTVVLRGTIPNPTSPVGRELVDGEFVTVVLEGARPAEMLAIPRVAVMTDQQGDYVYTLDKDNRVQQARVTLGQTTPLLVAVRGGLTQGQTVVVDGLQKVRPGQVVAPGPAPEAAHAEAAATGGAG
ncbi:MAG: efflux RND transporter periplasmic adaptor subunit [Acetobacteraceae bacterium]|nr:efflux RND transporter periplasmic adaptor subunit [Acetobacteraceae bacterium]